MKKQIKNIAGNYFARCDRKIVYLWTQNLDFDFVLGTDILEENMATTMKAQFANALANVHSSTMALRRAS